MGLSDITTPPIPGDPPPEPRHHASGFTERPGDTIGPFKLLEILGEGGFGVVWLAERREPMVQRVALKVIKPGMDSRAVIARFEQERRVALVGCPESHDRSRPGGEIVRLGPKHSQRPTRGRLCAPVRECPSLGAMAPRNATPLGPSRAHNHRSFPNTNPQNPRAQVPAAQEPSLSHPRRTNACAHTRCSPPLYERPCSHSWAATVALGTRIHPV